MVPYFRSKAGGVNYGGLWKREYFSAMAMQGLLAAGAYEESTPSAEVAKASVRLADAVMLQLQLKDD